MKHVMQQATVALGYLAELYPNRGLPGSNAALNSLAFCLEHMRWAYPGVRFAGTMSIMLVRHTAQVARSACLH